MNDVILALDGFENNKIYCGDTDSVYIHNDDYETLKTKGILERVYVNLKMIMVKEEIYMDFFWLLRINTVSLTTKMVYYHKKQLSRGIIKIW